MALDPSVKQNEGTCIFQFKYTAYSKGVNQANKYLTNYPKEVADETFDAVTEITTMRKYR